MALTTQPTYKAQMAFNSTPLGYVVIGRSKVAADGKIGKIGGQFADAGFVDLSTRLMGFQTRRGREDDLTAVTPGTTQLDLDDDDGALDPENTASPYAPNVRLMKRLRVVAEWPDYLKTALADQPAGYWRFGDLSGTTAVDSSGNGRDGAYAGAITLAAPGLLAGDNNTAATLNNG